MSVFSTYEKAKHFDRAIKLLESESVHEHYYACLELRFCIEAIVYQKLLYILGKAPDVITSTWEPNKAMKMLEQLDKEEASSCSISFSLTPPTEFPSEDSWKSLGEQKIPKTRWLSKNYNKLGKFLHLTQPKEAQQQTDRGVTDIAKAVAKELEPFVNGNIVVTMNRFNSKLGKCPACGTDFIYSPLNVKQGDKKLCINPKCRLEFKVTKEGGNSNATFSYDTYDIECSSCKDTMEVPESAIREWKGFTCKSCSANYSVVFALQLQNEADKT